MTRLRWASVVAVGLAVGWTDPIAALDVQGHRGYAGSYPDNSMVAFRAAMELGVTTLELDLQVTRDRVLVVNHDARVPGSRCRMDGGGPVPSAPITELTFDSLSEVDCRHKSESVATPVRIPRLTDVLRLARDADYPVRLSVEIKQQNPKRSIPVEEFARLVVDLVREAGLTDRTTIQSYAPAALKAVHAIEPELELAILVRKRGNYDERLAESGATILSPRVDGLTRDDVGHYQSKGIRVIPWTVNKPEAIRRMIEWGVDGIISDHPDRVLAIAGAAPGASAPRTPDYSSRNTIIGSTRVAFLAGI